MVVDSEILVEAMSGMGVVEFVDGIGVLDPSTGAANVTNTTKQTANTRIDVIIT